MDIAVRLGISDHEFRLVFGNTRIEYDPDKEELNRRNHGYSLQSAVNIFERLLLPTGANMPYAITDSFVENGEPRHMHMSIDDSGKIVLMVTTMRADETVRVISFRRANQKECDRFRELTGYVERV